MKNSILLFVLLLSVSLTSMATDRLVVENGLAPAYSSISAAVAAASAGDRIFIENRGGNIPWFENVTINKSLDIVAFVNDSIFICQGNWTISGGSTPINVNIIGMYNLAGSVTSSADATNPRDTIRLLGGALLNGQVNFNNNNYDLTVYGMKVIYNGAAANQEAAVVLRHGRVVGDSIVTTDGASGIWAVTEATVTNDTAYITGNVIWQQDPSVSEGAGYGAEFYGIGINWQSNSEFFDIRNNLVYFYNKGLYTSTSRASGAAINKIYNNTVIWYNNSQNYGYYFSPNGYGDGTYGWSGMIVETGGSGSIIEVMNNIIAKTTANPATQYTQYGFFGIPNGGSVNVYYNYFSTTGTTANQWVTAYIGGTETVNTDNNGTTTLAAFGGGPTVGNLTGNQVPTYPPPTTNLGWCTTLGGGGGNTGSMYDNLNLTTNTVGAYGGSYTLLNYFPQNTGATRSWMLYYPFNANVGTTINIQGSAFDR